MVQAVLAATLLIPFPTSDPGFNYFATPSGRIVCSYGGGGVDCTNFESGRTNDGELGQRIWTIEHRGHGTTKVVVGNAPDEAPKAEYGVTYTYKTIKCRIHRIRGIRCANRQGHGFRVSVERQRTF